MARCGFGVKPARRAAAVLLALLFAAPTAAAQQGVTGAALKIGYADAGKILDQAPQAEQARKLLEQEFGPRDAGLSEDQRKLRELEDRLADSALRLNDAERRQIEQQIRADTRDLERGRREFREDFNIRRNEELRKLQKLVYDIIVVMAKEQRFDLILNDGAVIFASDAVDLTEQVLERLRSEAGG